VFERDDEAALYRFARSLLWERSVSDTIYREALAHLGVRRVVDLVGVLGYYGLICMTINAFEIPVPEGSEDPFPPHPSTGSTAP
jgi:4-carboxymuconolactone decarboxylase